MKKIITSKNSRTVIEINRANRFANARIIFMTIVLAIWAGIILTGAELSPAYHYPTNQEK